MSEEETSEKPTTTAAPVTYTLCIRNLAFETTEDKLREAISKYAKPGKIRIPEGRRKDRKKGFGFVEMETKEDMDLVIENMNGKELDGRPLNVEVAKSRPHGKGDDDRKPRRERRRSDRRDRRRDRDDDRSPRRYRRDDSPRRRRRSYYDDDYDDYDDYYDSRRRSRHHSRRRYDDYYSDDDYYNSRRRRRERSPSPPRRSSRRDLSPSRSPSPPVKKQSPSDHSDTN